MVRGIVAVEDAIQKSFHDDTFSQEVIILEEWIAKAGSNHGYPDHDPSCT